ncbi:MAG TPA: YkgJ family cysteine cluster protein [Polyangiaceae bacterium]|nr:YkgJ family cysteine cluster protein [Polyangiaceae bacterium]
MKALSLDNPSAGQMAAFHEERELNRQMLSEVTTAAEIASLPLSVAARVDPRGSELAWQEGVACRKGCGWCCRGVKVEVTPPEAFAIAEYLTSKSEPERLPAVSNALQDEADEARSLSATDRWLERRACYFLEQASGTCSIWQVRPLECRSHSSLDASACESAHTGWGDGPAVPRSTSLEDLYGVARGALQAAGEDVALDMRSFELTNAVAVAFHVPRAAERWRAGERVFDRAVIPSDASDREQFERDAARGSVIPPSRLVPKNRGEAERKLA